MSLVCGHPDSLLLRSAETGDPLYCELCDERSRRRDAEQMEEEYRAELAEAAGYARRLAESIHAKCFADVKQWRPLSDVRGLLTQIDNMTSGLVLPKDAA